MTKPVPQPYRPSTLSKPKAGAVDWNSEMMRRLEAAVLADLPVKEIARQVGVDRVSLARGCALRLQQLLASEAG